LRVSFDGPPIWADQGSPAVEQRVAALKQSIAESQARLRKYEWIETTIISLKGEEKDRKEQRCYYGVVLTSAVLTGDAVNDRRRNHRNGQPSDGPR
jgi:hypothetical protein